MNLTPHFTVAEFVRSAKAQELGVDNSLPATLLPEAQRTCELLERIRAHLSRLAGREVPVVVSSGYRCLEVNRAVGSDDSSDHRKAMAADIKAPAFGSPFAVATALAPHVDALGIGQLIREATWVHVSTRQPDKAINRVITITARGTFVGIQEGVT